MIERHSGGSSKQHHVQYAKSSTFMIVYCSHPCGSPIKSQLTLKWLREPAEVGQEEAEALALKFSQRGCASSGLVGGKGCQLALLTQLQSTVRSHSFCIIVCLHHHPEQRLVSKSVSSVSLHALL